MYIFLFGVVMVTTSSNRNQMNEKHIALIKQIQFTSLSVHIVLHDKTMKRL